MLAIKGCFAALPMAILIYAMAAGGRPRMARVPDPPPWGPERATRSQNQYLFRDWIQDLMIWGLLAAELDPGQQCAAIIQRLEGPARELARNMSMQEITTGGLINGVAEDPVTFLLTQLATHFAPLGYTNMTRKNTVY